MTIGGTATVWKTPTLSSGPMDIITGPDGNLWFTEHNAYWHAPDKLGRITLNGEISEYWLPAPFTNVWGIAAGPDGDLWFTNHMTGWVGRIDPSTAPCPAPAPSQRTEQQHHEQASAQGRFDRFGQARMRRLGISVFVVDRERMLLAKPMPAQDEARPRIEPMAERGRRVLANVLDHFGAKPGVTARLIVLGKQRLEQLGPQRFA